MRSPLIPLFASCPAFLMRNEAPRKMKAIRKANGEREEKTDGPETATIFHASRSGTKLFL